MRLLVIEDIRLHAKYTTLQWLENTVHYTKLNIFEMDNKYDICSTI